MFNLTPVNLRRSNIQMKKTTTSSRNAVLPKDKAEISIDENLKSFFR